MPHYYFGVVDGEDLPDLRGSEHADLAAARVEAIRYSGEVLREMPERFWNAEEWDDDGIRLDQNAVIHPEIPGGAGRPGLKVAGGRQHKPSSS